MEARQTRARTPRELRLLTYLAPGLPLALFEGIAAHLERVLALETRLASDPTRSAPGPDDPDPFSSAEADLGFLCAPGYLWLADRRPPAVELVPAALQFDDPRTRGRPVYFADLVVASDSRARALADLRGARWVYNDPCSLSGYFSVLAALRELGEGTDFFATARQIGSHHAALAAVARGAADCAAIDSNTLLLERRRRAGALGVRLVEAFGPFPVQPVVARAGLPRTTKRAIAGALLAMHESAEGRAALESCAVSRFLPIGAPDYECEREWLRACGPRPGERARA